MYTYTKTEVLNNQKSKLPNSKSKKSLKSKLKSRALHFHSSLITSRTNQYLAERPKRTLTTTAATVADDATAATSSGSSSSNSLKRQKTSQLLKKAVQQSLSPVKKLSADSAAEQRSQAYRKSLLTGNLIENELIKYRRQNERLEMEREKQALKQAKKAQAKGSKKLQVLTDGGSMQLSDAVAAMAASGAMLTGDKSDASRKFDALTSFFQFLG